MNIKEKEKKKEKETNKTKTTTTTTTKPQQENYMIKDPLVTLLYMEKHAVYFEFLKRFKDIAFVKTVRCICFLFIHPVQLFPP